MAEEYKPRTAYQEALLLQKNRTFLKNSVLARLEERMCKIQKEALTFTDGGWDVSTVYGFDSDPTRIKEIVLTHPNCCWTTSVQRTSWEQVRLHRIMHRSGKSACICQGNEVSIATQEGYEAFILEFIRSMSWHLPEQKP